MSQEILQEDYSEELSTTEEAFTSFRVAPQWQVPSLALGAIGAFGGSLALENLASGRIAESIIPTAVSLVGIFTSDLCEDMASFYVKKYNRFKSMFQELGWDHRIVANDVDYFCGKRAALLAASDAGYKDEFNLYVRLAEALDQPTFIASQF